MKISLSRCFGTLAALTAAFSGSPCVAQYSSSTYSYYQPAAPSPTPTTTYTYNPVVSYTSTPTPTYTYNPVVSYTSTPTPTYTYNPVVSYTSTPTPYQTSSPQPTATPCPYVVTPDDDIHCDAPQATFIYGQQPPAPLPCPNDLVNSIYTAINSGNRQLLVDYFSRTAKWDPSQALAVTDAIFSEARGAGLVITYCATEHHYLAFAFLGQCSACPIGCKR